MKKFFIFAAMASIVVVSCIKNEPVVTFDEGNPIVFNSPVLSLATKAEIKEEYPGTEYPENLPFVVNAWYKQGSGYAGKGERYMENVVTEYVPAAGENKAYYKPVDDYYWPKNGSLSFIAYSPSNLPAGCSASGENNSGTKNDRLEITYIVPNKADDQVDLMYSDWNKDAVASSDQNGNGNYQGLDLSFKHALSVIKVFIKAADENAASAIRIGAVKINNIHKQATFTSAYGQPAAWSTPTEDDTYIILSLEESVATGAGTEWEQGALLTSDTQYANYMLLPQTLEDNATITIDYYIKHGTSWLPQNATLQLNQAKNSAEPQETISTWNMNTRYTYNISMAVSPILFAPAIVEWTAGKPIAWDIE